MNIQIQSRELVFNSFDKLISGCKTIGKKWKIETIPLITLETMLNKMKLKDVPDESLKEFFGNYNNILSKMYLVCEKQASSMNTKHIPIFYIQRCVETIKSNFSKGQSL